MKRLLLLVWLAAPGAYAQSTDILAGAPRTSIYVEPGETGNEGRPGCDAYRSASELISIDARAAATGCRVSIRIRGIINRAGARYFAALVDRLVELDYRPAAIVLDSRGGDADAAMFIGRLIRDSDIFRRAPVTTRLSEGHESVCFSACVVILAAGYRRVLEFDIDGDPALPSRVGIHGPGQFDRDSQQYDVSADNREIRRVGRRLRDYFRGMGVDTALVDDMFAVPFDEIRLLTREELVAYGLYE